DDAHWCPGWLEGGVTMAVSEPPRLTTGWEPDVPVGDTVLRRFATPGQSHLPGRLPPWVGTWSTVTGWSSATWPVRLPTTTARRCCVGQLLTRGGRAGPG